MWCHATEPPIYAKMYITRACGRGLSEFNNFVSPTHARNTYFAYIGWLGGMVGVKMNVVEYGILYSFRLHTILVAASYYTR